MSGHIKTRGIVVELRRMVPYYREQGHTRRSAVLNALRWSWLAPMVRLRRSQRSPHA